MSLDDEIEVPAGSVLFRQGDSSDAMFVVHSGLIRLTLRAGAEIREIGTVGPGEFFGEASLLSGGTRSASAEAVEPTRLLVVGRDAFSMLVQDDLQMVTRMLSAQGARLMRTNDPLRMDLQRLARIRVIARVLCDVGAAMRVPWSITVETFATQLSAPADALAQIIAELVARGAGTLAAGTWTIADRDAVDRLIAALVGCAGETASLSSPRDPFGA